MGLRGGRRGCLPSTPQLATGGGDGRARQRLHRGLWQQPGAEGRPGGHDHDSGGTGVLGYGGDGGPASQALLAEPRGLATDARGNVYIADADNHRVWKVDPAGMITSFAGSDVLGGVIGTPVGGILNTRVLRFSPNSADLVIDLFVVDADSQLMPLNPDDLSIPRFIEYSGTAVTTQASVGIGP